MFSGSLKFVIRIDKELEKEWKKWKKKKQEKKVRNLNFAWPLFHVSAYKHVILHGQSASIKKQHGVV